MKKRICALLLSVCLAAGSVSETTFAKTVEEGQVTTEAGVLSKEQKPEEELKSEGTDDVDQPGGYIDVPMELPVIETAKEEVPSHRAAAIPARYDGRLRLPSARDQNPYETCWAFSALASGEAAMIRVGAGTNLDLSEYQLSYFFYNHVDDPLGNTTKDKTIGMINGIDATGEASGGNEKKYLEIGGNSLFTTWAMAAWKAGGAESKSSYPSISATGARLSDDLAYDDIAHLQNAYWLPFYTKDEYQQENQQRVKEMIMNYGSVSSSYYHSGTYYDAENNAYYSPSSGTNHAIAIVGWDDDFSRGNFTSGFQPQENGAWLVRNSWGTGWGESGYFWMSYEENSINSKAFVFLFQDGDNYDYNYQYDGSSGIQKSNMYSSEISVANRFEVHGSERQILKAVSIGMYSTDTNYRIQIYMDPQPGNPISGIPMLSVPQEGRIQYSGYDTIPLEKPVILEPGHSFSVVFTLPEGGSFFKDSTYANGNWIRFVNDTAPNQSFVISEGKVSDLCTGNESNSGSARIKAFTKVYTGAGIYTTSITKADASSGKNGRISYGLDDKEYDSETIFAPARAEISAAALNYTGAEVRPSVKAVYDTAGKKLAASDYAVSYSHTSKNPGSYTMKISFDGKEYYTGSITKTYKIIMGPVSGLKNASQSTTSIKVSWKQQKYAAGYELYAAETKNGTYKKIATIKKNQTRSYTCSKLKSGKTYYVKIRAYKTIGGKNYSSAWSSILSSTTRPGKVMGLKAGKQSSSQIRLSWKKVSGASGYQIYRYNNAKSKYEKIAAVTGTSYTDKKLKAGAKYQYKVRAYRKVGNLTAAGAFTGALSSITKPGKITGVKASVQSSSQITLSWKKVNGASGYEVYRYNKPAKKYQRIALIKNGSVVSYKDRSLKKNKTCQYKVRAYKKLGNTTLAGSCSEVVSRKTKK